MATKKKTEGGPVKVRLLSDSIYGKADDVVLLADNELAQAVAQGLADAHPDAVAYAEKLKG